MSFSRTQKLAAVAAATAILITLAAIAHQAAGVFASPPTANMRSNYDATVAALALKSRTGISLPEREESFRKSLGQEDFREATKIASQVSNMDVRGYWASSPLADFMNAIIDPAEDGMKKRLDAWVRADDQNPLALVARAQYQYVAGWHIRGHGFYSEVRPEDQISFQKCMDQAISDLNTAFRLQIKPSVFLYDLKLRIQQSVGTPQDRQQTFQSAIRDYPNYYPLYQLMLSTLQPKWGGSLQKMYEFADKYTKTADQYAPLRLLYVDLYKDVTDAAWIVCNAVPDAGKSNCMTETMNRSVSDDLVKNVRRSLLLFNHLDQYQFSEAIRLPIETVMNTPKAGEFGSFILQTTADVMGSDTQLIESNPGRNNYVIDEIVAENWYRAGHFENSLKKSREALADLQHTQFSSGEAKDQVRARIYLQISRASGKLHDYVGQAAFESASNILGGRNGYEHSICFAFFRAAPPDEVLPACDEAVAANASDVETYYWRAQTHIDRNQGSDAASDLERVVGSSNDLRASSAIDLSMIRSNQNDNAAALSILNKYTYLYDEKITDKSTVAIAYNNRCYLYMKLGNLHKALDDCNNSLKYGDIPDASAKQRELEKRLANLPI